MFDSVLGLPTHILVLHVVVVLGPLAALLALAYAAKPAWRAALTLPLAGSALATGIFGVITGQSGESLDHRLRQTQMTPEARALLHTHTESGDLAQGVCLVFMAVTLAVVYFLLPANGEPRFGGPGLSPLWLAALVLSALAVIGAVSYAGHSGAKSAWQTTMATTTGGGGD